MEFILICPGFLQRTIDTRWEFMIVGPRCLVWCFPSEITASVGGVITPGGRETRLFEVAQGQEIGYTCQAIGVTRM